MLSSVRTPRFAVNPPRQAFDEAYRKALTMLEQRSGERR